eukprot:GHVL01004537.1.p1 GENE.GHVL01004537.1~~GHVL01004537.1.p1  ORF type:complete len:220 (+),score=45.93 GHVL01004537.1:63-722(+)
MTWSDLAENAFRAKYPSLGSKQRFNDDVDIIENVKPTKYILDIFNEYINIYQLVGSVTAIWGISSLYRIHKVLDLRYKDIAYQVRRPDALANRITAFKYLVLGGSVVPLGCLISLWACGVFTNNPKSGLILQEFEAAGAVRDTVASANGKAHSLLEHWKTAGKKISNSDFIMVIQKVAKDRRTKEAFARAFNIEYEYQRILDAEVNNRYHGVKVVDSGE